MRARQLLELRAQGPLAGDRQAGSRPAEPDGPHEGVDALLVAEPPPEHEVTTHLRELAVVGVDEVPDDLEPVGVDPRVPHDPGEELAGADEGRDGAVGPGRAVDRGLERQQCAGPERAVLAPATHGLQRPAGHAGGARGAVVEQLVARAGELVVVQGHDAGDARVGGGAQDRRRELVVDVVAVDDVGPEATDRLLEPGAARPRPQHAARGRHLRARPGGGRLELDEGREGVSEGQAGRVLRVLHPEEIHLVTCRALQVRDVQHVALGAAASVQVLVDMEDSHGCRRLLWVTTGPRGGRCRRAASRDEDRRAALAMRTIY